MIFNAYINNIVKHSLRWSTSAGTASKSVSPGFLFCVNAGLLNLGFEDELTGFTDLQKNLINGFFTGAVFSSTRGMIPLVVGSCTGGATVLTLHYLLAYLRENDIINFDMKF